MIKKILTATPSVGKFARRYIPQQIKPQELGIILPEGIINFQSANAARKCAKNLVIEPLHLPKPYERGVVVSNNQILDIIEGNNSQITDFMPIKYKKNISFIHGHPDMYAKGATTPISLSDFETLKWRNVDEIIAYNSEGAFSKLSKESIPQNNFQKFILQIKLSRMNRLQKKVTKEMSIYKMLEESKQLDKKISSELMKDNDEYVSVLVDRKLQLQKDLQNATATADDCKLIHNFWTKNAKKFGLKYETNYKNI